jgi:small-conductance mechanosensitive channel
MNHYDPTIIAAIPTWLQPVTDALMEMWKNAAELIPKMLTAIIVFAVGLLISKAVRKAVSTALDKFGIDALCEKIGISDMLQRASIKAPVSQVVGKAVFYILILMFLITATDSLGMPQFSEPLHGLIKFLPKVVTALIIFMVGFLISDLIRGVALTKAQRMGLEYADSLSNLIYGFLFVMVATIAISTLGVDTTLIRHTVEILLICGAVAIALALGLGMRPLAQNIVSGVYARELYKPGMIVSMKDKGIEAEVLSVGPVLTKLTKNNGEIIMIPNVTMVSEIIEAKLDTKTD